LAWRLAGPKGDHLTWRFERFSPAADSIVLSGSNNYGASFFCVLDARTGLKLPLKGGQRWPIRNVDFSSDGQRMLYVDNADETAFSAAVVDLKMGTERALQFPGFQAYDIFHPCALSPDGTRALVAGFMDKGAENGRVVGVFDSETGRHLVNLPGQPEGGLRICLSPDGRRAAMQNDEGCVLYNIESGKTERQLAGRDDYTADSVYSFSPDGQRILVHRLKDHSVIVDAFTGEQLLRIEDIPRSGSCGNAHPWRFSKDGRTLFGGTATDMQAVWDASDGRVLFETFGKVTLCPDMRHMMVWPEFYGQEPPYLFDLETGNILRVFGDPNQPVNQSSFSMDGQCFASNSGNRVDLWSRRRPEYCWGIAWLPEFWTAYFSGGALLVIAARNLRRRFRKQVSLPSA
jgi:WD40 repeat protein